MGATTPSGARGSRTITLRRRGSCGSFALALATVLQPHHRLLVSARYVGDAGG
jgi:hypothetical protein